MNTPFRCHDSDACAMGQAACPTPSICGCAVPACAVKDGTHKPADAVHQIKESTTLPVWIEALAASWDGCMHDAPGEMIDIGASIRSAAAKAEETHMRELTAYRTTVQNLEARLAEESARTAAEKLRADQMSQQHDTQAALNREARAELAEMKAKAQPAPQAALAAVPPGFAVVPKRLTRAMEEVLAWEGWQWEDLLAAANAVSESDYEAISRGDLAPAHPAEGVPAAAPDARDALIELMASALKTIGAHTITDDDGDEVEVLFGDKEKIEAAIAAQAGKGVQ